MKMKVLCTVVLGIMERQARVALSITPSTYTWKATSLITEIPSFSPLMLDPPLSMMKGWKSLITSVILYLCTVRAPFAISLLKQRERLTLKGIWVRDQAHLIRCNKLQARQEFLKNFNDTIRYCLALQTSEQE